MCMYVLYVCKYEHICTIMYVCIIIICLHACIYTCIVTEILLAVLGSCRVLLCMYLACVVNKMDEESECFPKGIS